MTTACTKCGKSFLNLTKIPVYCTFQTLLGFLCESVAVNAACETHSAFNEETKRIKWAECGKTMRNAFETEKCQVLNANTELPDPVKHKIGGGGAYFGQSKLLRKGPHH